MIAGVILALFSLFCTGVEFRNGRMAVHSVFFILSSFSLFICSIWSLDALVVLKSFLFLFLVVLFALASSKYLPEYLPSFLFAGLIGSVLGFLPVIYTAIRYSFTSDSRYVLDVHPNLIGLYAFGLGIYGLLMIELFRGKSWSCFSLIWGALVLALVLPYSVSSRSGLFGVLILVLFYSAYVILNRYEKPIYRRLLFTFGCLSVFILFVNLDVISDDLELNSEYRGVINSGLSG